jgi:hypothetical protein
MFPWFLCHMFLRGPTWEFEENLLGLMHLDLVSIILVPFESLSEAARKAEVLPGLQPNSLISVGKLADADYTTIFHSRGEGVTVHKKGTFRLKTNWRPVLQGWRDATGLWCLSRNEKKLVRVKSDKQERVANVYNLLSLPQTVRYLHAAAGLPTKDTWIKAIKNGH